MTKIFFKRLVLITTLILLSLVFRVLISNNSPSKGDILVHQDWAKILNQQGLSGSYFIEAWTYSPPTQPPLMMSAYYLSSRIYENRNIFSAIHNLIKIPPAFMLLAFQKYGQILTLKIWEYLATLGASLLFYFYYLKKSGFKKAITIFTLILFNPINIFINSVWGQNDLLPTFFLYSSFMMVFTKFIYLGPILFIIGALFKPTILILLPLYIFVYLFHIKSSQPLKLFLKIIIPILTGLLLIYFCFVPFIPKSSNNIQYIQNIATNRISTSSKGLNLASVSAFNLYSLIFNIDKTYANGTPLINLGLIFYLVLNIFYIYHLLKSPKKGFNHILFSIFFISQGSFLFLTNMLERYFFPAFISSVIIMILYSKTFGRLMATQQIIWFLNLIYAYYHRDSETISSFFKGFNFLIIRILSFMNIYIFFRLTKKYLKKISNET